MSIAIGFKIRQVGMNISMNRRSNIKGFTSSSLRFESDNGFQGMRSYTHK